MRKHHTIFTVAASVYIPTNSVQGLPFLHILTNSLLTGFLITAILTDVRCYLTVVFIGISLMISEVEHLYMLAICISSLEKNVCSALSFSLILKIFLSLKNLNWRIIVLECCVSFCCSVQFSCSAVSDSLKPHARPPCPSPSPGDYSNSCPSSWWCHPTISSSVVPFSSHLLPFSVSESLPMNQFIISSGQSIGVLAVQMHQYLGAQLSLYSNSHIHTWLLEKP